MSLDRNHNIKVDIRTGDICFNSLKYFKNDIEVNNIIIKFEDGNSVFDLTNTNVVCNIVKPNELKIVELINILDVENGIAELILSPGATNLEGIYKAEFIISNGVEISTTNTFRYKVSGSIEGTIDTEVVNTDEYHALITLVDTVRDLETRVNTNEDIRIANENIRILNEVARQDSMQNIQNNVNAKISQVDSKITEVNTAKNNIQNTVDSKILETNTTISNFENRFNALAPDQSTNSEVQLARTDANGVTHASLNDRLLKNELYGNVIWETVEG